MDPSPEHKKETLEQALSNLAVVLTSDIKNQILTTNAYFIENRQGREQSKQARIEELSKVIDKKLNEVIDEATGSLIPPSVTNNSEFIKYIKTISNDLSDTIVSKASILARTPCKTPETKFIEIIEEKPELKAAIVKLSKFIMYEGAMNLKLEDIN